MEALNGKEQEKSHGVQWIQVVAPTIRKLKIWSRQPEKMTFESGLLHRPASQKQIQHDCQLISGNAQNETAWDEGNNTTGKAEYNRSRLWAIGRLWGLRGQEGKRQGV